MSARNFQIGIDLGTTNSEIAIYDEGKVEIVKNDWGIEHTPSVFGFDKSQNPVVGKVAYEALYRDPSEEDIRNFKAEIKRIIGTPARIFFPRVNREYSPEEISAEILKYLKGSVLQKYPAFNTEAAVITTPASFDTVQAEATKRAGNLAGFRHVVLIQEPIAAAIAYGYENARDENLLVYDLGGGTFDVALISCRGGNLSVLGHNGNNFLGGKDFDSQIVQHLILPRISGTYQVKNWEEKQAAKLRYLAESGKIALSRHLKTTLEIEHIGKDDQGKEIALVMEISRGQFEDLIRPLVEKTLKLCKKTMNESGINPSVISRILLVGGPTQIPFIRERLADELKIPVDTSMDPLTVVAKGACIYAIGQQIPEESIPDNGPKAARKVSLFFNSLSSDPEESVTGRVEGLEGSGSGYILQIQSDSGHYTTKIQLRDGKFFETVTLLPRRANTFWIYLFDHDGNILPVYPDSFTITHGLSVHGAPIPHSIGVAVATRDVTDHFKLKEVYEPIFEKGAILPLRSEPQTFHTLKRLKKGEDNYLPIKIYEGESDIPDRNTFICDVRIDGKDIPHDLLENTGVELTLSVDESRVVNLEVYLPLIDRRLAARGSMTAERVDTRRLEDDFRDERERASRIGQGITPEQRGNLQHLVNSIEESLKNSHEDEEEARKADKLLKELKIFLDEIEKEKEFPNLVHEHHQHLSNIEQIILTTAKTEDRDLFNNQLDLLRQEGQKAIDDHDQLSLARVNGQLADLGRRVLFSQPAAWIHSFRQIETSTGFTNHKEAEYYLEKGRECIRTGDFDGLRDCVIRLVQLLPTDTELEIRTVISGITY